MSQFLLSYSEFPKKHQNFRPELESYHSSLCPWLMSNSSSVPIFFFPSHAGTFRNSFLVCLHKNLCPTCTKHEILNPDTFCSRSIDLKVSITSAPPSLPAHCMKENGYFSLPSASLRCNSIGPQGAKALADALKINRTLASLRYVSPASP